MLLLLAEEDLVFEDPFEDEFEQEDELFDDDTELPDDDGEGGQVIPVAAPWA